MEDQNNRPHRKTKENKAKHSGGKIFRRISLSSLEYHAKGTPRPKPEGFRVCESRPSAEAGNSFSRCTFPTAVSKSHTDDIPRSKRSVSMFLSSTAYPKSLLQSSLPLLVPQESAKPHSSNLWSNDTRNIPSLSLRVLSLLSPPNAAA